MVGETGRQALEAAGYATFPVKKKEQRTLVPAPLSPLYTVQDPWQGVVPEWSALPHPSVQTRQSPTDCSRRVWIRPSLEQWSRGWFWLTA